MAGIQEVYALVEKGKAKVIANAVQEALDAGCDPTEILNDGMIKACLLYTSPSPRDS